MIDFCDERMDDARKRMKNERRKVRFLSTKTN